LARASSPPRSSCWSESKGDHGAERPDYQPVLKSLTAPALVCAGNRDSYSTAEITAELAGCLRDPEVVVMDGVGHLPNLERPDDFNEHLLRFLRRAVP
jgi:pimeloyl-ACP methyl ester carboxylesterase